MGMAYRLSGSTWSTGLIGFLASAPNLFLAPFAGVLGDRVNRRKLLILVLSLMALQSVVLAVLSGLHLMTLPLIAGLALFAGICNAFEIPTRQSIFVQLLDHREDLANAVAMNSLLMNGTRLIGPSIGGVLIASFGETVCFAVNAVTYVAVVGALMGLKANPRTKREPSHPRDDLADGWTYSMRQLTVRRMLFVLAAVSVSISPYGTLMPAIAVKTFGRGAETVGLFIGAVGLGAFIAAINLAMRHDVRGLGQLIRWDPVGLCAGAIVFWVLPVRLLLVVPALLVFLAR